MRFAQEQRLHRDTELGQQQPQPGALHQRLHVGPQPEDSPAAGLGGRHPGPQGGVVVPGTGRVQFEFDLPGGGAQESGH